MDVAAIVRRARDIGATASEIEELMGILPGEPELPDVEKPREDPAAPSHLVVGLGKAVPSAVAEIEILGGTEIPVLGYGMRFGIHTSLKLNHWSVTKELKELTGLENAEAIVEQADWENSKAYGKGAYISIFHLFRDKLIGSADVERLLKEIEAVEAQIKEGLGDEELAAAKAKLAAMHKAVGENHPAAEVLIPPMTPMLRIGIKVPEDAPQGATYDLLNRSHWFGRPVKGAGLIKRQMINNIFGTSHEYAVKGNPYRYGLECDLHSGEIVVI